jgi:hypothetical protein
MNHLDDVLQWLSPSIPREMEKNVWGEVFTPRLLVEELLHRVPDSVWADPRTRWLDPAAGSGHFPALIFLKLNETLRTCFPDALQRKRHIVENMLYMTELNPDNVAVLRTRFGPSANIVEGDFLQQPAPPQPFDVIVGNPPYQSLRALDVYKGSQGKRTLWNLFVRRCLSPEWLDGFLAFITPGGWRRPESPLYHLMTRDNQLLFLHVYGEKAGRDLFRVQTRFDLYVIQCKGPAGPTLIIDEQGQEELQHVHLWPFLPNFAYAQIRALLVPRNEGIAVIFHSNEHDARKLKRVKTTAYPYPVVHTQNRQGLGVLYANRPSVALSTPKVILNFNRTLYPYNDFRGEYGLSQLSFGIPLLQEASGDAVIRALQSESFQHIVRATKWTSFQTDYRMFRYFSMDKLLLLQSR